VEIWNEFQKLDYANDIMLFGGGLLILIGVIKIVKSSIKLLIWVVLAAFGFASASYAMNQKGIPMPDTSPAKLEALLEPGKEMSKDALEMLCRKLPDD